MAGTVTGSSGGGLGSGWERGWERSREGLCNVAGEAAWTRSPRNPLVY